MPLSTNVAVHQLNRSGKRNARIATPADNTTPRTLIRGLLGAASVSKSAAPPTKKTKLTKGPSLPPSQKRRKSTRQSLDNATPRTIIKNYLIEASPETPLEAPEPVVQEASLEEKDDTIQSDSPNSEQHGQNSPGNKTEDKEDESAIDQAIDQGPTSENHSKDDSRVNTCESTQKELEPGAQESTNSLVSEVSESTRLLCADSTSSMEYQPGISTMVDDTKEACTTVTNFQHRSKWKDLVTPKAPVSARRVLRQTNEIDISNTLQTTRRSKETVKRKTLRRPITSSQRKPVQSKTLPSSLIKSIFEHFSKRRIKTDTLEVIENGSVVFFKQLSSDLMAYSQHAGRTTIDLADVELLMKRQGLITSKQSLNSLIEKYLPLEYRQELIPVAQSGNKTLLKKSS